ncbi:MAG: alpha-mannosidase [Actinobacteria bacterium]|nr:alpha-mannosidase [Actinomycetota bacterium]
MLVGLVDRVLDLLEAEPDFVFTLDGQLATIDDYLEIRPENEERIRRLVIEGRLAIGPWQTLVDEFLVSGEAIVRNLERGLRRGEELGGAMRVGYLPDMFGHVAQMPQILRLAGIEHAVVWRGVPAAIDRHAFTWEGLDGSAVRAEYLPAGYGNGAYLLAVPDGLTNAAAALREAMEPFFDGEPILAMCGTDHQEPLPELVALAREAGIEVKTLPGYLDAANGAEHPRWRGELRSGARANLLMGVASARIDLKVAAARAERALERYAEPLQALWGGAWPERLLDLAWSRIFDNSAHDSIGGCSADEVSAQVLVRYAEAQQIADGLASEAAVRVAELVPRGAVAVLNPSPQRRSGLVELDLQVPDDWIEVGLELPDGTVAVAQEIERHEPLLHDEDVPAERVSEFLRRRLHGRELYRKRWNGYALDEADGRTRLTLDVDDEDDPLWLDTEGLQREITMAASAAPEETWQVRILARPRRKVVARVPAPALGWTAVRPTHGGGAVEHPVDVEPPRMSNGLVSVSVDSLGRIVQLGDVGDTYNYAPPVADVLLAEPVQVSTEIVEVGPVRGKLEVARTYRWQSTPVSVLTSVELHAGEPFYRVRVSWDNQLSDQRVRFHIPLPEQATGSFAEGQFAVVERGLEAEGGYGEVPLPTFPARGFVAAGGLAVLLDHVLEYELVDEGRELALTLLRSVGLISRNVHPYRENPAGPELPVPAAQMHGPWSIGFAVYPDAGDALAEMERYQHPFLVTGGCADGDELREQAGFELAGESVALTGLRRQGDRLEARVVNQSPVPRTATMGGQAFELRPWEISSREAELAPRDDHG